MLGFVHVACHSLRCHSAGELLQRAIRRDMVRIVGVKRVSIISPRFDFILGVLGRLRCQDRHGAQGRRALLRAARRGKGDGGALVFTPKNLNPHGF